MIKPNLTVVDVLKALDGYAEINGVHCDSTLRRAIAEAIPLALQQAEANAAIEWLFTPSAKDLPDKWHYFFPGVAATGTIHEIWKDCPSIIRKRINKKK